MRKIDGEQMKSLDEIKARLKAATPGPWKVDAKECKGKHVVTDAPFEYRIAVANEYYESGAKDASLIAHAPTDLAFLLGLVERQQRALEYALMTLNDGTVMGNEARAEISAILAGE